ncbi:AMP-binding protein [Ramlibacter henchirensis]|uniref:AMP-binding protein n=1 Tax=Ramlibacter henchirensis TaxID=204072 RepID=UPI001981451A|nr:AMP-binding protein [Ramlibacter henchirensis]
MRSIADIEALEQRPLRERLDAATVPALIRRGAGRDPAKAALRFLPEGRLDRDEIVLSHGELLAQVHRAARLFRSLGVGRGDVVALLLPNLPETYVALLGAMCAGIAMPVNWMLRPAQLESLLRAGRPKVVVAAAELRDTLEALPAAVVDGIALLQVGGSATRAGWTSFEEACASHGGDALEVPEPEDVAAYIHTGGATGQPKLAKLLHRGIAYKCWAYRELLGQRPEHVALGVSPLFHVGGIVLRAIHPLACGMSIVIPGALGLRDREVLRRYWQIVEAKRVTELSAVPTSLGVLAEVDPGAADLSSLRPFAITGSSTLPLAVAKRFEQRIGVRLLCDYGLTEYTATVALPPPGDDLPEGSCGLRLPYTQVRIVRGDGRECAPGEIGEILVNGPGLVGGYLDAKATTALFTEDGWARTGDLGRMDGNGFLFITGRAKDIIIRGGHNIDPRVIEETLQSHDDVALAAAVGQLDAYAGEVPVAYVQLKKGNGAGAEELQAFAKERIPERAAAPVAVHVLQEMPLTGAGKVNKPLLREMSGCAVIERMVREAGGLAATRVTAVPDPVHGTVYRVAIAADASTAARLEGVLAALPCRCEVTPESALEVP